MGEYQEIIELNERISPHEIKLTSRIQPKRRSKLPKEYSSYALSKYDMKDYF